MYDNVLLIPNLVFEGLDWKSSDFTVTNCPHTVWEIVNHMDYWQAFIIKLLEGDHPSSPEHSEDTWPKNKKPSNEKEWNDVISSFIKGIKKAEIESTKNHDEEGFDTNGSKRADLLQDVVMHNSYHIAQVVLIRRMLEQWPPPSGGDSW